MKRLFSIFLAFALAAALAGPARAQDVRIREIQKPAFSAPAFALPGGAVAVTLKTGADGTVTSVVLKTLAGDTAATVPVIWCSWRAEK